ncbi:hypothetical protein DPMN_049062 [Dreissena polymorpha]|uniref:Uncharacterized protein n=1 Tax=Dreissena polymorpha TaxID=45954 RepID=A0A9D4DAP4_DREPO|nr:hypothetical protein DPMN_049062 [Dreissena polymorpha]
MAYSYKMAAIFGLSLFEQSSAELELLERERAIERRDEIPRARGILVSSLALPALSLRSPLSLSNLSLFSLSPPRSSLSRERSLAGERERERGESYWPTASHFERTNTISYII